MRLIRSLLGCAWLVLSAHWAAAEAADWQRPDTEGKYYWVLVNAKSIRRDGAKGWTRFIYSRAGGPNNRSLTPLGRSRVKAAFDCRTGQFYSWRDKQWQPGGKGQLQGPVRDFVCKR